MRRNYLKSPTWTCKEDTIMPFVFSGSLMVRGNWDHEAMSWWADENGTCTGIVLAYPFSFPWHIQIPVHIMQYKSTVDRITVATRAWSIDGRKADVGFTNNKAVLLGWRETCKCMHTSVLPKENCPAIHLHIPFEYHATTALIYNDF
jgi:hypothetical protein